MSETAFKFSTQYFIFSNFSHPHRISINMYYKLLYVENENKHQSAYKFYFSAFMAFVLYALDYDDVFSTTFLFGF